MNVNLSQRMKAVVLALSAAVAWLCAQPLGAYCDSLTLALRAASVVAAAAAMILLLPPVLRRAAISAAIVFHFGAILTAVAAVPLPGGPAPWLANQIWFRVYRPYLQFMYLNNAYHFYSPEPGAATILWCRVQYSDGSTCWVECPGKRTTLLDPLALEYYRRVAMNESVNQLLPITMASADAAELRMLRGETLGIPTPAEVARYLPGVPQYRVPTPNTKHLMGTYARHLALAYRHADPAVEVSGIKIYRVVHAILPPRDFAQGGDPADPTLYLPYYHGEFDREGALKDPDDPFLYWLVPILAADHRPGLATKVNDYLRVHAQQKAGR
jgi:hypothetical protein